MHPQVITDLGFVAPAHNCCRSMPVDHHLQKIGHAPVFADINAIDLSPHAIYAEVADTLVVV